jgi:hypothetical protein
MFCLNLLRVRKSFASLVSMSAEQKTQSVANIIRSPPPSTADRTEIRDAEAPMRACITPQKNIFGTPGAHSVDRQPRGFDQMIAAQGRLSILDSVGGKQGPDLLQDETSPAKISLLGRDRRITATIKRVPTKPALVTAVTCGTAGRRTTV